MVLRHIAILLSRPQSTIKQQWETPCVKYLYRQRISCGLASQPGELTSQQGRHNDWLFIHFFMRCSSNTQFSKPGDPVCYDYVFVDDDVSPAAMSPREATRARLQQCKQKSVCHCLELFHCSSCREAIQLLSKQHLQRTFLLLSHNLFKATFRVTVYLSAATFALNFHISIYGGFRLWIWITAVYFAWFCFDQSLGHLKIDNPG